MSGDPALLHASSQAKGLFQKTHPGLVKPCRDVTRKVQLGHDEQSAAHPAAPGSAGWPPLLPIITATELLLRSHGDSPEGRVSSRSRPVPQRLAGVVAAWIRKICVPNSHGSNDLGQIRPAMEISFDVFCRALQI